MRLRATEGVFRLRRASTAGNVQSSEYQSDSTVVKNREIRWAGHHPRTEENQTNFRAIWQYNSTASLNCCFSTYSPSVCAT